MPLRPTRLSDHRGTPALAICAALAGVLVACGGGGGHDEGYVAVERPAVGGTAVAPTGDVTFVPLDEPKPRVTSNSPPAQASRPPTTTPAPVRTPGSRAPSSVSSVEGTNSGGADTSTGPGPGMGAGAGPSTGVGASPSSPPPTKVPSAGPARLITGDPEREPTDERWCEQVTLAFHNAGGSPVRSGTVTFGTHIIDALGIDWATIESSVPLPVPIGPGARAKETWTVCVEAWRVPWGMRVETRDVEVEWA
ncbi:hypothetical protein ACH4TV_15135 [Streptomyces sp. NPDC020898]|uniref:hypothetical protein n=1 Tax=Streptomyces sp. NPDC020898 TaxID=3365101 RepID=UPI0037B787B0